METPLDPQGKAEGLLFAVRNRHTAECGTPPAIDANVPGRYHGYFENEYGEQAVFVYHRETGEATLFAGDLGWENPVRVVDGRASGVILGKAESAWLRSCWEAATAGGRQ